MGTFTNALIREVGRNYGKAISNALLGDKHANPVRITGTPRVLGGGSGGRNYENKLDKLLDTYTIKGHVGTFNIAQNMVNYYMDLVQEAQEDNQISLMETHYLIKKFKEVHKALGRIYSALNDLDKPDWAEKVNDKDLDLWNFVIELCDNFELPPEPSGWGFGKKFKLRKLNYKFAKAIKEDLDSLKETFNNI
ncbi:hypothetical protein N9T96_01135 [Flavobacteriaceae bacterium]|nr:hypothetical protein [Flavobacteriaceae bacterium]